MNKPDAIVFFDLDGTLLTSQLEVLPSTIQAINQLKQNNIMPMLSTGRTYCEVKNLMQKVGIDSIISMNGQAVIYQGQPVYSNDINTQLIEKIYQFSQQETGIALSFYNNEVRRVSEINQSTINFYHDLKQDIPPVDDRLYQSMPIQMLLLLCQKGESLYIDKFPELTFIRNSPYCVDVFNQGGSKGNGIKQLLTHKEGLADVPTYAFGDGMNDFEMFETVDHPIAMANAVSQLKSKAKYITDTNDNDGIVKGLQHFGLV